MNGRQYSNFKPDLIVDHLSQLTLKQGDRKGFPANENCDDNDF